MTVPGWPTRQIPQPGVVPLRPLGVGDLLSIGVKVAWRNLPVLGPLALAVAVVQSAAQIALLAATGYLDLFVSGKWVQVPSQPTVAQAQAFFASFWHVMAAVGGAAAVGLLLTGIVVGPAAAGAAEATLRFGTPRAALARLRGRWGIVVLTSVAVGLAEAVGFVLLIVPGLLAAIFLLPAVPVAALEGGTVRSVLARALYLSRGFRPRIFGVLLLTGLFGWVAGYIISSIGSNGSFLVQEIVTVVLAAFVTPWSATVQALLYVDIRFRREGLAQALAASVAAS